MRLQNELKAGNGVNKQQALLSFYKDVYLDFVLMADLVEEMLQQSVEASCWGLKFCVSLDHSPGAYCLLRIHNGVSKLSHQMIYESIAVDVFVLLPVVYVMSLEMVTLVS
jgi:hypothetical protein